jgi:hypothetical protein
VATAESLRTLRKNLVGIAAGDDRLKRVAATRLLASWDAHRAEKPDESRLAELAWVRDLIATFASKCYHSYYSREAAQQLRQTPIFGLAEWAARYYRRLADEYLEHLSLKEKVSRGVQVLDQAWPEWPYRFNGFDTLEAYLPELFGIQSPFDEIYLEGLQRACSFLGMPYAFPGYPERWLAERGLLLVSGSVRQVKSTSSWARRYWRLAAVARIDQGAAPVEVHPPVPTFEYDLTDEVPFWAEAGHGTIEVTVDGNRAVITGPHVIVPEGIIPGDQIIVDPAADPRSAHNGTCRWVLLAIDRVDIAGVEHEVVVMEAIN